MTDDDKLSIQVYLESRGAWTTELSVRVAGKLENMSDEKFAGLALEAAE